MAPQCDLWLVLVEDNPVTAKEFVFLLEDEIFIECLRNPKHVLLAL